MRALATLLAMLGALAGLAAADDAAALERRVKAAFIARFPGYVDWPAGTFADGEQPIVIGVAGAGALAAELEQAVTGRLVGNRALRVQRLGPGEAASVHVLFVGGAAEDAPAGEERLAQSRGKPILTVTDSGGAQPPGSVIHFVTADRRVRFDVSRAAAERNGLRIGSPLLAVARQVRDSP